jgi:Fe-S-cluster containining protein
LNHGHPERSEGSQYIDLKHPSLRFYARRVQDDGTLFMQCRESCAACCIAPSISSAIPGMPNGKPAGVPCIQLDEQLRCKLFGLPERPACCSGLQPSFEMCGENREQAIHWLAQLEQQTRPENH